MVIVRPLFENLRAVRTMKYLLKSLNVGASFQHLEKNFHGVVVEPKLVD